MAEHEHEYEGRVRARARARNRNRTLRAMPVPAQGPHVVLGLLSGAAADLHFTQRPPAGLPLYDENHT